MGRALAETALRLQCSERTLRRCVNDGMLHGEQFGRGELRLPRSEELYLLRHWELLSKLRRALRTEPGVKLAVLFGSVAVGEDRPDSDVDVLVDHTTGDPAEVVRLQRRLGGQVGKPIHLVLREDVQQVPVLLADILQEGRVIVDRDDRWPRLLRSRPRILREAKEEEAAIRAAAWRGIDEARQRLEAG